MEILNFNENAAVMLKLDPETHLQCLVFDSVVFKVTLGCLLNLVEVDYLINLKKEVFCH